MGRILSAWYAQNAQVKHVFTSAKILTGVNNSFDLEIIIIDSGSTFNLILRLAAVQHYFHRTDNLLPGLQSLDRHSLCLYQKFQVSMHVCNVASIEKILFQDIYLIEMTEIDIILGITWLESTFLIVNYSSKTFFFERLKLLRKLLLQDGSLG